MSVISDHIEDGEAGRATLEFADGTAGIDLERSRRILGEEHDPVVLGGGVDQVEVAITVNIVHLDCRDLIRDAHGFALEHPVVGQIIDPGRDLDGVIGAGVGLLVEQVDAAVAIVDDDDVLEAVPIEGGDLHRSGPVPDGDDLQAGEAEVVAKRGV